MVPPNEHKGWPSNNDKHGHYQRSSTPNGPAWGDPHHFGDGWKDFEFWKESLGDLGYNKGYVCWLYVYDIIYNDI